MRLTKIFFFVILLLTSIGASAGNIIPQPRSMEKRGGAFTILTTTKITHSLELRSSAKYLAEYAAVPEKMQTAPLVALAKEKAL